MILRKSGLAMGAVVLGSALALSACSSGSDEGDGGGAGGTFSMAIEKPQAMTPSNCYDLYCAQVNRVLFTGLFAFEEDETGDLVLESSLDYWLPLLPAIGILWEF